VFISKDTCLIFLFYLNIKKKRVGDDFKSLELSLQGKIYLVVLGLLSYSFVRIFKERDIWPEEIFGSFLPSLLFIC
jgi:hypothetical protein